MLDLDKRTQMIMFTNHVNRLGLVHENMPDVETAISRFESGVNDTND